MSVVAWVVRLVIVGVLAAIGIVVQYGQMVSVKEGEVAVVYWFGRLQEETLVPGYHFTLMLGKSIHHVPVVMRTAVVEGVECGSASGVTVNFDRIEVVYRLRKDAVVPVVRNYGVRFEPLLIHQRVHSEVNQLCSREELNGIFITHFDSFDEALGETLRGFVDTWAPGLEIIAIRVTKPMMPTVLQAKYDDLENMRSQLKIVEQQQQTELKKAETAQRQAVLDAEKQLDVSRITSERMVEARRSEQEIAMINANMIRKQGVAQADALYYRLQQEAQTNNATLTREYLDFLRATMALHNTRMFLGSRIPSTVIEEDDVPVYPQADTTHQAVLETAQ